MLTLKKLENKKKWKKFMFQFIETFIRIKNGANLAH